MAKFKKDLSDKVRSKLKHKGKSAYVNPFEIKVNKVKHSVVNKKVEKWEKGLPGVSRSKAIKKRKDTILNELRQMKKSNSLHDKRIGEKDSNLTPEEKMVQRFALERKMQSGKQSAFNLNDEEVVLTHYGQSLAENLKDKPGSDSEDDDPYLDRENTGKFQFGGFSSNGNEVTWKDKMNEVITESKKHKYQQQMEKEKSFEATKELDGLWKSVVCKMKPQNRDALKSRSLSNFMMLSRSLVMEQKSEGAADKFKNEEQKAREEAEKLKKLEAKRLERMNGVTKQKIYDHISADSLSNGYAVNKKGKLKVTFADDSDDESEYEMGEKQSDDKADEDDDGSGVDDEKNSDDNSESDDDDEDDDSFSDLDDDEESDNTGEESDDQSNNEETNMEKSKENAKKSILKTSKTVSKVLDKPSGTTGLPFVFEAPTVYEDLQSLLQSHTASDQILVISRLRKCYHPSLAEDNKEKLQKIHLFLLQYFGDLMQEKDVDEKLIDAVASHLWEMTQTFPSPTAKFMQDIVLDSQKEYTAVCERRGGRGLFPSMKTLGYLRLIEMLFPTSDFRHEVTTPSIHFIAQMLAESSVRTLKDVTSGLFLCALCLRFVHASKRYIPEMLTFLHGVLYLSSCSAKSDSSHTFPPFRKVNRESCQLELMKNCDDVAPHLSLTQIMNSTVKEQDTDSLRCNLVNLCIELLLTCNTIWSELSCLSLVMQPISAQLQLLPSHLYPKVLKEKVENLTSRIEETKKVTFKVMQHASKKPEPLALFEPKIEENWSGKRKKGGSSRDVNTRQRLVHKHKREMKSAIREIKRDNAVLAKHKLDTIMQKDADRKRKVKEIMSSLANQEGDYKAIQREKS